MIHGERARPPAGAMGLAIADIEGRAWARIKDLAEGPRAAVARPYVRPELTTVVAQQTLRLQRGPVPQPDRRDPAIAGAATGSQPRSLGW
jgi:hypothetical protein